MASYVAFIRAVNVAGHARIKMDAVQRAFEKAGCKAVRTVIQSGNVIFDTPRRSHNQIRKRILTELGKLIPDPVIMFRTLDEVRRIVAGDPFKQLRRSKKLKFYVAFLATPPETQPALPGESKKEALEMIRMDGLNAFLISRPKPNGFYGFPNNFVEKELGVAATCRNWTTVARIMTLANT